MSLNHFEESWIQISCSSGGHIAAIRSDATLWTWGLNASGQLGDGTVVARSSAVQIPGNWSYVECGNVNTFAIDNTNKLYGWGASGQLYGSGSTNDKSAPVQIKVAYDGTYATYYSWSQISSGQLHTAAIRSDAMLFTWGLNTSGQLGDGTVVTKSSPVQIGFESWIQVSVGITHTAAINSSNKLFTWGYNLNGELGNGTAGSLTYRSSPVQIGSQSWIQVSAGGNHTAAINSSNTLFTWGLNSSGQLGDGTAVAKSSPVQIGTQSWIQVSAGYTHTAAINSSNKLFTWGGNSNGQLGDGTAVAKSSPVQIGSQSWIQVSAGYFHTAAINSSNLLFTWGYNLNGELGNGTAISRSSPVQIGSQSWIQVSAGSNHMAAINSSNLLFTWGYNLNGELGNGTAGSLTYRSSPVQIGSQSWIQVSAGGNHTAAINSSNNLFTWGLNSSGQLGDGTAVAKSSPVNITISKPVFYSLNNVINVSCHDTSVFALRSDGALFAWGSNGSGQLGINNIVNEVYPRRVNSDSWIQVSAGGTHTAAINSSNKLFTWGLNTSGQLGDGTVIAKSTPLQIGTQSWIQVSAGTGHSAAINSSNTLFTWGLNSLGQLGDDTVVNKSSPVQIQIQSLKNINKIKMRGANSSALDNYGNLFLWGNNDNGQVDPIKLPENKTIRYRSYPVQIDSTWYDFSYGSGFFAGIKSDRTLWSWGSNTSGQLGYDKILSAINYERYPWIPGLYNISDFPSTLSKSPVLVNSTSRNYSIPNKFSSSNNLFKKISTNYQHDLLIDSNNKIQRLGKIPSQKCYWLNASCTLNNHILIRSDGTVFWDFKYDAVGGEDPRTYGYLWNDFSFHSFGFKGGITQDGTLWLWGSNTYGQLGDNTTVSKNYKLQVSGSWNQICLYGNSVCGIKNDGTLWAWGRNDVGQLGDGTVIHRSSPVQIGANTWLKLFRGKFWRFNGAIRSDGTLWMWGENVSYIIDQTSANKSSPVQIGNDQWKTIAATQGTAGTNVGVNIAGIKNNDTLWIWGDNGYGQFGRNDILVWNRSTPVQISGSWNQVSLGTGVNGSDSTAVLAIDINKKLWAWGYNNLGQLGDGTTVNRSSPVQIGNKNWEKIVNAEGKTIGFGANNEISYGWGGGAGANGNAAGSSGILSSPVQVPYSNISENPTYLITYENYVKPSQLDNSDWKQASAGNNYSIMLNYDGKTYVQGIGNLGISNDEIQIAISPVDLNVSSVINIFASNNHSAIFKRI